MDLIKDLIKDLGIGDGDCIYKSSIQTLTTFSFNKETTIIPLIICHSILKRTDLEN